MIHFSILTQKRKITRRMADKLDERLSHGSAQRGVGGQDVGDGEKRKHDAYPDYFQSLQGHVLSPEAGQTLVPDGGQQLLDVRMRHKLRNRFLQCYYQ